LRFKVLKKPINKSLWYYLAQFFQLEDESMNVLSIDTTADICSIALVQPHQQFLFHERRPRAHAKILLPEIEKLVIQANLSLSDIDLIVFGRGPGSFTGIRIATGVTQGLAYSIGCPVLPISTLSTLAYSASLQGEKDISVAIDARMSEIYFARFSIDDSGIPVEVSAEKVIAPALLGSELNDVSCLIGNGWRAGYDLPEIITQKLDSVLDQGLPNALHSAQLAQILLAKKVVKPIAPELAVPIYLRDNVTWDNKPKIGS
jgi:tRNA threonylcarbamoyladenosine biosynthesis protein TsaB